MSWFYLLKFQLHLFHVLFKYILCLGSTKIAIKIEEILNQFKYILCLGSTEEEIAFAIMNQTFKYILCLGSTPRTPLPTK